MLLLTLKHRAWLFSVLTIALLCQASIPSGFMAAPAEGGWFVAVCPDGLPAGMVKSSTANGMQALSAHSHHHHHGTEAATQSEPSNASPARCDLAISLVFVAPHALEVVAPLSVLTFSATPAPPTGTQRMLHQAAFPRGPPLSHLDLV